MQKHHADELVKQYQYQRYQVEPQHQQRESDQPSRLKARLGVPFVDLSEGVEPAPDHSLQSLAR
jgi:hypothetical protein